MRVREPKAKRNERVMAKGWIQAVVLVSLLGFTVLGFMAARTYQAEPPIPDRVVTPSGVLLFSGNDVRAGQDVFLRNGLMEFGSVFGHGGYLGPDFTADYLHRAAVAVESTYGGAADARQRTVDDFRTNTYDPATGTLVYTDAQAGAFETLARHYQDFFADPAGNRGSHQDVLADQDLLLFTEVTPLPADPTGGALVESR